MTSIILSCAIGFIVAAAIGPPLIGFLKKQKVGQKILEIGPKWHVSKENTPTMGGLIFIIAATVAVIAAGFPYASSGQYHHIAILIFALGFALIGFFDDYAKIKRKQNKGLSALQKLALQIGMAAIFLAVLRVLGYLTTDLYVPFFNIVWALPVYVYMPFAVFVIVGAVNAVNLTDGIDGLASGATVPIAAFFGVVAFLLGMESLGVFAAAVSGSLLGFLLYNFYPAKVFMGDTGSLFLGGAVCGMAFACNMPLILVIVGLVYIVEALSDIVQVFYFKISGGKRVFKMAPIHHHFEMSGWSERKIVTVFTCLTILLCIGGYFGVWGLFA